MYLVQTFKIVWLNIVIELISSNCNPTATCAGSLNTDIALVTVSCKQLQMCNELTGTRQN